MNITYEISIMRYEHVSRPRPSTRIIYVTILVDEDIFVYLGNLFLYKKLHYLMDQNIVFLHVKEQDYYIGEILFSSHLHRFWSKYSMLNSIGPTVHELKHNGTLV